MAREKVIKTVHDIWKDRRTGVSHNELTKKLEGGGVPEEIVQALVDEGAIIRLAVAGSFIYLPSQGNRGISTGSHRPVSVDIVGEGPRDVTDSSRRGSVSITPVVSAESKEYLPLYQRVYGGVSRLIGGFRKEIREIFKHYRADAS